MKSIYILLITVFIIIPSCRQENAEYAIVERADNLLNADSVEAATALLQQIDTTKITKEDLYIYYSYVKTIIAFRNYEEINSDSLISLCADFYQKYGDKVKYATARHYQSNIQYELGKITDAVKNEKIAEDIAEQIHDYKLLNKIYTLLTIVNFNVKDFEQAFFYARKQIETADKIENKKWKAYAYLYMVIINNERHNTDSVSVYIDKCLAMVQYLDNDDNSYLYSNLGEICLDSDSSLAEKYFQKALSYKKLPESFANLYAFYRNIDTLKALQYKDSALANAPARMQIEILKCFAHDEEKARKYQKMSECLKQIIFLQDSLIKQKTDSEILELQKKYDFEKQNSIFLQRINLLMFIIITMVLVFAFIYVRKKIKDSIREKEKLEMECQKAVSDKNKKEEEIRNIYIRTNMFSNLQNTLNWLNEQLLKTDSEKQKQVLSQRKRDVENQLTEILSSCQEMYKQIKNNEPIHTLDKEKLDLFVGYYETIMPSCKSFFIVYFHNLLTIDKIYLILSSFENKSPEQICRILAWSEGTIRSRKSKIKSKQILECTVK